MLLMFPGQGSQKVGMGKELFDNFRTAQDVFNEVYTGPLFIHPNIVLSHEPIELKFGYNIHGHKHGKTRFIYRVNTNVMINVAADVIDYTPVRLDKIIQEFKVTDIHRVAIEKQKERK